MSATVKTVAPAPEAPPSSTTETESNPQPCQDVGRHLPPEIESGGSPCADVIPGLTDWENY